MKHGKKYNDSIKLIDHLKQYDPEEAVDLVLQTGKAKFDETVEISVRLGVDPRHADQQVRGAVFCPTEPAGPSASWLSPRATRPRKRKKPVPIM